MAWKEVQIKSGDVTVSGMQDDSLIECPNVFKKPSSLLIDGKNFKVSSFDIDERDDLLKIKLAIASQNKGESDDQPKKRSN